MAFQFPIISSGVGTRAARWHSTLVVTNKIDDDMHVGLRKLRALHTISDEEASAFVSAISHTREVRRGEDIAEDGSEPKHSTIVTEGIACRYKQLHDGRRQILSFQYPGDITDLYSYVLKRLDHAVGALTDCVVSHIPHAAIQAMCEKYPNLAYALWRDTLVDTSKLHSSITSLGARTSKERLAHFLAEQYVRMRAVDLGDPDGSPKFGITQSDLADATGLSLVHVNKTLKKLKEEGLISWNRSRLTVLNWERLIEVALFDETYLHIKHAARNERY
jgi:CRP-like cAMP-binding protein